MSTGNAWPERRDETADIDDACFDPIDGAQLFPAGQRGRWRGGQRERDGGDHGTG